MLPTEAGFELVRCCCRSSLPPFPLEGGAVTKWFLDPLSLGTSGDSEGKQMVPHHRSEEKAILESFGCWSRSYFPERPQARRGEWGSRGKWRHRLGERKGSGELGFSMTDTRLPTIQPNALKNQTQSLLTLRRSWKH